MCSECWIENKLPVDILILMFVFYGFLSLYFQKITHFHQAHYVIITIIFKYKKENCIRRHSGGVAKSPIQDAV